MNTFVYLLWYDSDDGYTTRDGVEFASDVTLEGVYASRELAKAEGEHLSQVSDHGKFTVEAYPVLTEGVIP